MVGWPLCEARSTLVALRRRLRARPQQVLGHLALAIALEHRHRRFEAALHWDEAIHHAERHGRWATIEASLLLLAAYQLDLARGIAAHLSPKLPAARRRRLIAALEALASDL